MFQDSSLFCLTGILFICLAVPLMARAVKPNRWYGLRVKKTLCDERVWYAANRTAGFDLLLAGVTILVTGIVTSHQQANGFSVNVINIAVFIVSTSAAVAHSFWSMQKL